MWKRKSFLLCFCFLFFVKPVYAEPKSDIFDLSLAELMNLEITTAGKHPEKVSNIPANVIVVTRSEIATYGYNTLTEVLENTPGLYNIDNYLFAPGNFGTRGFWNPRSQNASFAILVNGINQVRADEFSNPLEKITVPVESIDRIEFIKGPMSVLYGNGASFGVLNIVTNETDEKLIAATTGSRDTHRVTIRSGYKNEDIKLTVDLGMYQTDGFDYRYADMSEGSQLLGQIALMPYPGFTTKDRLEHDNNYLHLDTKYKNFYFDFTSSNTDREFYILIPATDEGTLKKSTSNTAHIGYQDDLTKDFNLHVKTTYSKYNYETVFEGITPGKIGVNSLEYRTIELELITDYQIMDSLNLVTGLLYHKLYDYEQFTNIPVIGTIDEYFFLSDRVTKSIYAQATYEASDSVDLFLGFRYEVLPEYISYGYNPSDSFSSTRGDIINRTPRIAMVVDVNDQNTLKLMYGEASRISDDRFDSELISTLELNHVFKGKNYLVNSSIFYSELENLLVRERDISGSFPQQSIGEIATIGIETVINANFMDNLEGEFAITFQSSENKSSPDIDVAYSPETVAHAKLAYSISKSIISMTSRYVSSMLPFYDFSNSTRIGNKIDGYFVLDANYRIKQFYKEAYFNLRITNILDEEIRYPNNPENNGSLANGMNKGTIGQAREFMATLGWNF